MGRGARTQKTVEQTRRCISTAADLPKSEMIRFVLSPDGVVTPDLAERLPGRGIWVSATRDALQKAIDKKLFSRGAKAQATVPENLLSLVDQLLAKRIADLISLARRSGDAMMGFETVKGALVSGKARVLIQAFDGSVGQKQKLRPPEGRYTYISCLTSPELGLAFGRDYAIHAALTGRGLSKRVVADAVRLAGIRASDKSGES
ncbi:hypothetical protein BFP76_11685 [Amylibacter kogurei]|uniref:YlxR domain-containing protein n=1 Tax=Paramylibacter kogurei TaxID=1889778 RepID=A0A2G5KBZ7_9RHOB|nr:RNA-binding protein [Amylibacter kogurei]PIB26553.1 hypothetical protein BFP76_11685 [Amylibacter kogurei]